MPNTRWLVLNKKRALFLLVTLFVAGVLCLKAVQYWQETRIDPQQLFDTALHNTMEARSFCFRVETDVGRAEAASEVTGMREAPGKVHIKGNLQDTRFELVHLNDKTYFKESATGKWFSLTGNNMVQSDLFMELNPLESFNFKDIPEINYRGLEQKNGEKLALLELYPNVNNQFLLTRFNEFHYRIWIDPENKFIRRAVIAAKGLRGEKDTMKISIELWDYNKQIKISPPEDEELTLPD